MRIRNVGVAVLSTVGAVLLAAPVARAVDGVHEIDAACVAAGCFPGDAPGLPVEITERGSYRLTSNLVAPSPQTAIEIAARYVTLDLGGFSVLGTGARVDGFRGVWVEPAQGFEGILVRNGTVQAFYEGVALEGAAGGVVEDLRVVFNAHRGISLHTGLAKENVVWANGVGIRCVGSLLVHNVFSFGNGTDVEDAGGCQQVDNAP